MTKKQSVAIVLGIFPDPLESKIEDDVVVYARQYGVEVLKFTPMGQAGWPDREFLYKGEVLFVEFKKKKGHYRKLQDHRLSELRKRGFMAERCNNQAFGKALISELLLRGDARQQRVLAEQAAMKPRRRKVKA